ncbi:unnamed protein product [Rhizoctonia solani]|uniref:Transmembrane protein n=1 Tax=Rhizoctonia solani TaxID=456999 RepID=A0A8H3A5D3_9AGAM|nr:unnamed protein product [Rhizoctonia solani]
MAASASSRSHRLNMDELEVLEQHTRERFTSNKPLYIGPFLSAGILDALFCGFLLMQGGKYVLSCRKDSLLLKLGTAYVILMNLAGSTLTWVWVYDLFVYHFGTYHLFQSSKYISWFFIFNSTTVVVVQVYFGWRAWVLTGKNTAVAVAIGALIVCALGGGIGMKIVCSQLGGIWDPKAIRLPAYICASCTVAADSTITGIILFFLLSNRSGCSSRLTRVIDRTIRITFESQLPPTLSAIMVSLVYLFNCWLIGGRVYLYSDPRHKTQAICDQFPAYAKLSTRSIKVHIRNDPSKKG